MGIPFRTFTTAGAGGLAAAVPPRLPAPMRSCHAGEIGVVILACALAFDSP